MFLEADFGEGPDVLVAGDEVGLDRVGMPEEVLVDVGAGRLFGGTVDRSTRGHCRKEDRDREPFAHGVLLFSSLAVSRAGSCGAQDSVRETASDGGAISMSCADVL